MSTAHTPTLPLHWDGIDWSKVRDCTGALLFDAGTPEKAREFVRACNSHAALVAALEQVCFVLTDEFGADATWPCIDQAGAALAAAKE